MKTSWDYSELAKAYLNRPDYAPDAIERILTTAGVPETGKICDVGAGVAHLTLHFAKRNYLVAAVEPNDAMRTLGKERTAPFRNVVWHEGTGEKSGQPSQHFDLVSFGSSFNVTDRSLALRETDRLLRAHGWFTCLWNHRDIEDPLQRDIEACIRQHIPNYDYGSRRQDQTEVIEASGLFEKVTYFEGRVVHAQKVTDCVEAWRSHATLQRQAGTAFTKVVDAIERVLERTGGDEIQVPYTTRVWMARSRKV